MRLSLLAIALLVTLSINAKPLKRSPARIGTHYARIVKSSVRRVLPGRKENPISFEYKFVLVWHNSIPPQSIVSYCNNKWQSVGISAMRGPAVRDLATIKKGDTLVIKPLTEIQTPIAGKTFKPVNNAIFFKTNKKYWFYLPAKKMTREPDLALP